MLKRDKLRAANAIRDKEKTIAKGEEVKAAAITKEEANNGAQLAKEQEELAKSNLVVH